MLTLGYAEGVGAVPPRLVQGSRIKRSRCSFKFHFATRSPNLFDRGSAGRISTLPVVNTATEINGRCLDDGILMAAKLLRRTRGSRGVELNFREISV